MSEQSSGGLIVNGHEFDTFDEFMEWLNPPEDRARTAFSFKVMEAKTAGHRFNAIRNYYGEANKLIMAAPVSHCPYPCYEVQWDKLFTPIEYAFWSDLRTRGAVMYPQYPVGKYFVDFGHPKAKIAVECDGAAYHQDWVKDENRQRAIESLGWKVFRLTGSECHEPERSDWFAWDRGEPSGMGSGYRLITYLNYHYGIAVNKPDYLDLGEIGIIAPESYYESDETEQEL